MSNGKSSRRAAGLRSVMGVAGLVGVMGLTGVPGTIDSARADVVSFGAAKDNTLYQDPMGNISNGAGQYLFCGRTAIGPIRRGLIEFDLAAAIPPGSTVRAVTLQLSMSRSIGGEVNCSLNRVTQEWGEGASDAPLEEGQGTTAVPPDATWLNSMYSTALWAAEGGDFVAASSGTIAVTGESFYLWPSSEMMVADVQAWVDDPSSNHGWAIIGDETTLVTAKRWDSRESPAPENRPLLRVEFNPPVCLIDYNGDGLVDFSDYLEFLNRYDAQDLSADLNGDGLVDFSDYLEFLNLYESGC